MISAGLGFEIGVGLWFATGARPPRIVGDLELDSDVSLDVLLGIRHVWR